MQKENFNLKGTLIILGIILGAFLILSVPIILLSKANENKGLGSALPLSTADYTDSLALKITTTSTIMTLVNGRDSSKMILSGLYGFTIDEGETEQEYVLATCATTACTGMTRGITLSDGGTASSTLQKAHRRGATIKITDYPLLAIMRGMLNGSDGFPNLINYTVAQNFTGASSSVLVDKNYVDASILAGAADATDAVKGISELATLTELRQGALNGSTSARLIPQAWQFGNTPSSTYQGILSDSDGKLAQGWLDLTEGWAFGGQLQASSTALFGGAATFYGTTSTFASVLSVNGASTSTFTGTIQSNSAGTSTLPRLWTDQIGAVAGSGTTTIVNNLQVNGNINRTGTLMNNGVADFQHTYISSETNDQSGNSTHYFNFMAPAGAKYALLEEYCSYSQSGENKLTNQYIDGTTGGKTLYSTTQSGVTSYPWIWNWNTTSTPVNVFGQGGSCGNTYTSIRAIINWYK